MAQTSGRRFEDSISRVAPGLSMVIILALASCTNGEQTPTAVSTVTTVVTAEPSSTTGDSSSSSPRSALTSAAETMQSTPQTGEPLRIEDFFQPGPDWEANRYDIAGKSQVQGIATSVATCYGDPSVLELRLSNKFEALTFSVAQADNSDRSDLDLTVEVLTNNEQAEIRAVPFNQVQEITVPVNSVNAVQFRFFIDPPPPDCRGSVIAVLHDVTVS